MIHHHHPVGMPVLLHPWPCRSKLDPPNRPPGLPTIPDTCWEEFLGLQECFRNYCKSRRHLGLSWIIFLGITRWTHEHTTFVNQVSELVRWICTYGMHNNRAVPSPYVGGNNLHRNFSNGRTHIYIYIYLLNFPGKMHRNLLVLYICFESRDEADTI